MLRLFKSRWFLRETVAPQEDLPAQKLQNFTSAVSGCDLSPEDSGSEVSKAGVGWFHAVLGLSAFHTALMMTWVPFTAVRVCSQVILFDCLKGHGLT